MRRALNLLRPTLHYRKECFDAGLKAVGFDLVQQLREPGYDDLLVIWNRYGAYAEQATYWERSGARVLVVENGYLGKHWRNGEWFSLALNHHSGAGKWPDVPGRWESFHVELKPWRTGPGLLIFQQRGIGETGIASPDGWAEKVQRRIGGRIRKHPGKDKPTVSLEDDLLNVGQCVTWHSGAALLALMMGVPVWYDFPRWIGARAGLPLALWGAEPKRSDADRLETFQRLAGSIWTLDEIKTGEAFEHLLGARRV